VPHLRDSVEVVEAKVLRLGFKETVFVRATRHYVRDVQTVSYANNADH